MTFPLNPEQQQAVAALRGRVVIAAGAGSGKTRTLTERFVAALDDHPEDDWARTDLDGLLAITFTDKAAGELAERVRRSLYAQGRADEARAIDLAWVSTIHGFCSRLLRRHALEAGLDPSFRVLAAVEADELRMDAFEAACLAGAGTEVADLLGEYPFDGVLAAVKRLTDELVTRRLTPASLECEPVRPAREILAEAIEVFCAGRDQTAACADTAKTAASFHGSCSSLALALEALGDSGLGDAELAGAVLDVIGPFKPGRPVAAFAEAHGTVKAAVARLTAEAAATAAAPYARALASLVSGYVAAYEGAKREAGALDFEDLQTLALGLLESHPALLARYREQFKLVMIDEFQDTNALQLSLVEAVGGDRLCTVGDAQQSIYGFRGADVAVYERHLREMGEADARRFELFTNYRSKPQILEFVNELFSGPGLFDDGLLELHPPEGAPEDDGPPRVEVISVDTSASTSKREAPCRLAEAREVATRLASLRKSGQYEPRDMVLLLRTYGHAHVYADALAEAGLEALVVGGSRFFGLPEVAMMRAFVGTLANPLDDVALAQVLSSGMFCLSDEALLVLGRPELGQAYRTRSLWEALRDSPGLMTQVDRVVAERAIGVIERAQQRHGAMPLSEVLLRAVEEADLDLVFLATGDDGRQAFANVLKLCRLADTFERTDGSGAAGFAAHLDARETARDHERPATLLDADAQVVRIMSIHSAKGLEFPVVAVPELGQGRMGDRAAVRIQATEGAVRFAIKAPNGRGGTRSERATWFAEIDVQDREDELAEMARLFYVACTRAEDHLILSGSSNATKDPAEGASLHQRLRTALPEAVPDEFDEWCEVVVGCARFSAKRVAPVVTDDADLADEGSDESTGVERRRTPAQEAGDGTGPGAEVTDVEFTELVDDTCDRAAVLPDTLSYSSFASYKSCPRRFWAESVLRLGSLRLGTNAVTDFGSLVHALLEQADGESLPDQARVAALAAGMGVGERDARLAVEAASNYLASATARDLAGCDVVSKEWPFTITVSQGAFLLGGFVDAYGRTGPDALVVDYKTGTSGTPDELVERYRLQASVYALVAMRDGAETVRVVFTRPQVMTDGRPQEFEYRFTAADASGIEAELSGMHERMQAGDFGPRERWDPFVCEECPAAGVICPVREACSEA